MPCKTDVIHKQILYIHIIYRMCKYHDGLCCFDIRTATFIGPKPTVSTHLIFKADLIVIVDWTTMGMFNVDKKKACYQNILPIFYI